MDVNTSDVSVGDAVRRALKLHLNASAWQWLTSQAENLAIDPNPGAVARTFTSLPRRLKSDSKPSTISLHDALEGPNRLSLVVKEWTIVKLARVWLLMCIPKHNEAHYVQLIEQLFKYGDMDELTALYSALPVYHYPEAWQSRCKEGIRSNIGPVRHAVMVNNPYPAAFLDDEAWNQLVLKAFFTEEDIPQIAGLKRRNNLRLAQALTDYAYERYAAQREINPMLWVLVGPFLADRAFELMERIMAESRSPLEQKAIAYALNHSGCQRAQRYLKENNFPDSFSEYRGTPWEAWESDVEDTKNKRTNR
ncbi:EboA domain-containing protein [Parapedobacter sp.]